MQRTDMLQLQTVDDKHQAASLPHTLSAVGADPPKGHTDISATLQPTLLPDYLIT